MQSLHRLRDCLSLVAALVAISVPSRAQCPEWKTGFDLPRPFDPVRALAVFDDGTGPALFFGGAFGWVGYRTSPGIARWDGTSSSAIGSGLVGGQVCALVVFDDGAGPALFAGGNFTASGGMSVNRIAKWDGASWSPLGSGMDGEVCALGVFDDGTGPALIAGGSFTTAGGVSANRIAKWDGTTWSRLGGGVDSNVHALTVFDDGTGPALFAGGSFTSAGGMSASRIAKWNGTSWSTVGSGMDAEVLALSVFDDGTGAALFAGGGFTSAGSVSANRVAKWDGASWSALGSGMNEAVHSLGVFDDGTGPALFVGGGFTTAGGISANRIAKWDGTSWSLLGSGMNTNAVNSLAVFDEGTGPALFAAGSFLEAGDAYAVYLAKWNGASWLALGQGLGGVSVLDFEVFDDGNGPALFVGGPSFAGGQRINGLGKWDGTRWSSVGNHFAQAFAVFDDGSGSALYGAWYFWAYGFVAKWNGGTSWSSVGVVMPDFPNGAGVRELEVFDDGNGPALFAAGDFTNLGTNAVNGTVARRIARWDGVNWSVPGGGVNNFVWALKVFDDGTGPSSIAGGDFTSAGGVSANRIAKWNGVSWSPVGGGVNGRVQALAVFDDGTGPALCAGGDFTMAGGVSASRIAKWDGASWSPIGNSGGSGMNGTVRALTVFDDGTGPALYAGGSFTSAGGVSANRIAKWDGTTWSALGNGIALGAFGGEGVNSLAVFNDGADGHPDLFAGGNFTTAGGVSSNNIAQWLGGTTMDSDLDGLVDCADNCPGDFNPAQEDCDSDGLGDLCAIASGASTDGNFDGIPDECGGRSYCTGKTNSLGCVPFMSSVGFASVTNTNPFLVMASDSLPNQFGVLLCGSVKSNFGFHGGTLCVHGNILQYPSKMASATGSPPCAGILKSNMNKRIQSGVDPMLTAGARIYTQWRQRDPNDPAGFGDSFTNGLTFVIQP